MPLSLRRLLFALSLLLPACWVSEAEVKQKIKAIEEAYADQTGDTGL